VHRSQVLSNPVTSQSKAATLLESSLRLQSRGPSLRILEFNDFRTPQLPPSFMVDPLGEATRLNRAGGPTTCPLLVTVLVTTVGYCVSDSFTGS